MLSISGSIAEVMDMRHLDLFSGVGGFALSARWVWGSGHEVAAFCEKDEYCQKVLKRHWPEAPIISDIRELDGRDYAGIDVCTGGFPCQPFSAAGQRRGTEDDRHLWPEMHRVIREVRPRWVLAENVYGLTHWSDGLVLEQVLSDLEAEGYETLPPLVLPAAGANAPHRRYRVWIVAHAKHGGLALGRGVETACAGGDGLPGVPSLVTQGVGKQAGRTVASPERRRAQWSEREAGMDRTAHDVPHRVDRIKALGNAVVPELPARLFETMRQIDPTL